MSRKLETIEYHYRGLVERGRHYRAVEGYSANSEAGNVLYPWMTVRECREDAKRQGKRAVFRAGRLVAS